MTLHLVGLPHTRLDGGFDTCAYTGKVSRFRQLDLDRELVVYGCAGADVELLTEEERLGLFGTDDPTVPPIWPTAEQWRLFNARAVAAITERAETGDTVLLVGGYDQRLLVDALPHLRCAEPFVGYQGTVTEFCAFESHAWRHYVYGRQSMTTETFNGRWFDTVIPNYFDSDDFPHLNDGDGDYLLFIGRMVSRKGIVAARDIAAAAGIRLVYAGPGASASEGVVYADGHELEGDVHYVGPVDRHQRAQLLAGARAVIVPTLYVEPFGGVAVEAMFAGTPVIASDFGSFTETVEPGLSGFRFATLAEAVAQLDQVGDLDPETIRHYAIGRYGLAAVAPLFRDWIGRLETLDGDGWYALPTSSVAGGPPMTTGKVAD